MPHSSARMAAGLPCFERAIIPVQQVCFSAERGSIPELLQDLERHRSLILPEEEGLPVCIHWQLGQELIEFADLAVLSQH